MGHQPLKIKEASKNPKVEQARAKEWGKLQNRNCWSMDSVRRKQEVADEAQAHNKKVHFGNLMEIFSIKHAELDLEFQGANF
eukprot:11744805-Karenia_brevis.AAC.1